MATAQNRPSVRVFKSDFLERFTHVHPLTPLILWTPVIATLLYRSFSVHGLSVGAVALAGLGGFVVWTLAEYLLHRYVFHFPATSAAGRRFHFLIHGLHHDDPNDATRLVMPPVPAVLIATVLFMLFRPVLGQALVEPFFALFLVGYLCYDYIHYYTHHFKPKSTVGKFLKQNHMLHHYSVHGSRWGVSSPL